MHKIAVGEVWIKEWLDIPPRSITIPGNILDSIIMIGSRFALESSDACFCCDTANERW
jgi:hypothetical protein